MLKVGIVGLGQQGSFYTHLFQGGEVLPGLRLPQPTGGQLVAIADADPAALARLGAPYPDLQQFTSYEAMLDAANLDAVLIESPHYFHPAMAIEAMRRNVHVLVEKPAGVFTNDVQRMNDFAATKPDLTFAMMFNQRANPLYQKLKDLVTSGAIGAIRHTDWTITTWWRPQSYFDLSAWRATWAGEGGGVLINQAPHQVDLWQWICGMPASVFCKAGYGRYRDIAVEDDVVALASYAGGATGVFRTATHDMLGTDRFEILGDQGKIVVEGSQRLTLRRLSRPEREISHSIPPGDVGPILKGEISLDHHVETEEFTFESAWGQQHRDVIQNFLDAINEGTPLVASGFEGIRALELTNAMHLSSWLQREVTLPLDADLYEGELQKRIDAEGSTG